MRDAIMKLLSEYYHANTKEGVQTILDVWKANKTNLIKHLSKHPNWDAENYRIVFNQDFTRDFDREAIPRFRDWITANYIKVIERPMIDGMLYDDFKAEQSRLTRIQNNIERLNGYKDYDIRVTLMYKGEEVSTLTNILYAMNDKDIEFRTYCDYVKKTLNNGAEYWMTEENAENYKKIMNWMLNIAETETNLLSADMCETLNNIIPLGVNPGTKVMKAIRKMCVKFGFDKIVDMAKIYDNNGNMLREKDLGYNFQIAQLGDAINPLVIRRHTIVSVNPLDYLTMSFGHDWASCHTIDKENERGNSNHYSGCYCSGTLSYMLDQSSVIFYTVDESYNGHEYETQDKMQRCMFHINNDGTVMVQGRVYPDGRDGGDRSFAAQFRNVMQKIVSDCFEHNNLWVIKKGSDEICHYEISDGTHYKDYEQYDDCTVSVLKGVEFFDKVHIGHDPICPNCGEEHEVEDWLCCEDCNDDGDYVTCYMCDDRIRISGHRENLDRIYCSDNDNYYCCERCAEQDDLHYCEDDNEWHTEDYCYYNNYTEEYHSGEPNIITNDGNQYDDSDEAERDGYLEDGDGEWWPESEIATDDWTDERFHCDEDTTIYIDGHTFSCEENAEAYGYHKNENDEWILCDDEEEVA